ncbi:MAG: peptidase M14, partial [Gemmatimonadetes bacterium]|nr:peptidase M14 [Gemmatimonadota bacterium]
MTRATFASILVLLLPGASYAQQAPQAADIEVDGVTYNESVPRPEEILGYVVGTRHTEPYRVVEYFRVLAETNDRVTVAEHGRTHEDRPLIHAVVTSPRNHARLEDIRDANRALSDAPASLGPGDLEIMPAVVVLGYSVHGDEASGTEAALLTLYHLAAGSGQEIASLLDSLVILIDPMLNPDGRDRFVDWVNRNRGATHTADPQDREHREPWPGGRTNHYWVDLNRDWLPARQPETRARLKLYHEWRPQLVADFHEMGGDATYFFQPGIPSRTHPNTPLRNQELTGDIARYHARALDKLGQLYFTQEVFDDFYYGKGSTYPDVNGAVGILFEQASSRALESETNNGLLPYALTVRNQFATSLSTLQAARDLRMDLLSLQRDFYAGAPAFAEERGVGGYVLPLDQSFDRAHQLASLLQRHRVAVHELNVPLSVSGRRFEPGQALIIPGGQPQARLIDAMLTSRTTFADSMFYDVSAWTLPLAFDLEILIVERTDLPLGPEWSALTSESSAPATLDPEAVAYVVAWDGLASARFLGHLHAADLQVRLMTRAFALQTRDSVKRYPAGALVVASRQNGMTQEAVMTLVSESARLERIEVHSAISALTPDGPDLGGSSAIVLSSPSIALLTGPGTSSSRTGEVWDFFSSYLGVPISLLDLERLAVADLDRYDVVLFAGGAAPDSALAPLEPWIRAGGRLITAGSAVDDIIKAGFIELTERPFDLDSLTAGVAWGDRRAARGA